ncbi:hypothetical protein SARC_02931 [Sphaeroforma arctica JP610]|uniref:Condensin complex subunit 1 C-terminal domain-containing protein n=1 Tax=Sphaeroforma arctica JP610 TaxID=667725 RepID=A0A0L0G7F2_9EUKA|nr:hypothetical protein SARC_02931 [Sphaeroforma arctica JP610]KNC84849.1 hypothetical protein SARC_02931 [Sphaeroforma arctica JP610]|eukprot:XP_014158751.1 hypothetical protein SARC_02931 [Sphaeroforma arctica JP610]
MERTPDSVGLCAQAMFALQSDETTPSEIEHSILTLSTAHAEGISGTLVELLRSHSDHGVRQTAAEALGVLCTAGLVLGEYVLDSNEGPQNCTRMAQILLAGLMDGDGDVRATCVKTCALLAEKGSVLWKTDNCEALLNATIELFNDRLSRVRLASVKACKRIFSARKRGGGKKKGKKKALSAVEGSAAVRVVKLLCDEDADVRMAAIEALTKLGSATQAIAVKQIAELFIMLPWHPAVKKAFMALENVSIPVLEALEMHDNEVVRTHAGQLLQSILTESDSDCESDDNDSVNDVNLVQMDVHARGVEGLHDACTHINKTHEAWTCTCLCALCITARITCAKRRIRPAATATDWGCVGTSEALQQALCAEDVRDTLRRMDCAVVSQDEWNEYYAHTPQVIVGCTR